MTEEKKVQKLSTESEEIKDTKVTEEQKFEQKPESEM